MRWGMQHHRQQPEQKQKAKARHGKAQPGQGEGKKVNLNAKAKAKGKVLGMWSSCSKEQKLRQTRHVALDHTE